jgi:hypothetical protein
MQNKTLLKNAMQNAMQQKDDCNATNNNAMHLTALQKRKKELEEFNKEEWLDAGIIKKLVGFNERIRHRRRLAVEIKHRLGGHHRNRHFANIVLVCLQLRY